MRVRSTFVSSSGSLCGPAIFTTPRRLELLPLNKTICVRSCVTMYPNCLCLVISLGLERVSRAEGDCLENHILYDPSDKIALRKRSGKSLFQAQFNSQLQ